MFQIQSLHQLIYQIWFDSLFRRSEIHANLNP
jgi:hypothetical protein